MASTVCKVSKNSRGSMPPTPLELLLLIKLLKIKSVKKPRLKRDENWCFLPEKISEYAPGVKTFSKDLFTPVSHGFKRLCI